MSAGSSTGFPAVRGRPAYVTHVVHGCKGPQAVDRRESLPRSLIQRRSMLRRSFLGIVALAVLWTVALAAQVKELPKTPVRPLNAKIVDINTAPEADIAAVGIDKAIAKKIVDGRPYRNKRDLVTRQLLSQEQYDKVKNQIVAKQPPKK